MTGRIGIVGGGIVGSAAACWLLSEGYDVTVYERDIDGLPASAGNAALLAIRELEPLARPTTLFSVPRWMADVNGPLTLRAGDLPALMPWLLAFAANSRPSKVAASREALTGLMREALPAHEDLGRRAGITNHIRHTGALTVYDRTDGIDAALHEAAHVKSLLGHDTERLSPETARQLVPSLEGPFAGAVLAREYRMVTHPLTVLRHLQSMVRERGTIRSVAVDRVMPAEGGPRIVDSTGEVAGYDAVVVAAGIWSRDFVRKLGLKVLLEAERGYNTTFPDDPLDLPLPVFLGDHGFVASPLRGGLRIGGAVELASPAAPASRTRAPAMLAKMRRYFPSLPHEGGVEWMGRRPSTPDSMPVIGPHPHEKRIFFAFGHGHLGLTLSAITARLLAGAIAGKPEPIIAPFAIDRFQ